MSLANKLLLTQPLPSGPTLQNNNLSFMGAVMTYVHDNDVVVVEAGGSCRALGTPAQEVDMCQSKFVLLLGEPTLVVTSSAGVKLCDRTGRQVLFNLSIQQLNRMTHSDISYVQDATVLSGNEIAFGTNKGQLLVIEFPPSPTVQPMLKRIVSVASVPVTCLASDEDHVVCGCADGSIYAFEIATFTPCLRIPANRISAPCTSIGVRSRVVIAAFSTGHLRFYRLFVDEVAVEVAAHARPITQLALHPRKPLVATCSEDQHLSVWTLPDFSSQATSQVDLILTELVSNSLLTGVAFWEAAGRDHLLTVAYDVSTAFTWVLNLS